MNKRVHLFISGRVQGVFFRYTTKAEADRLGVKGWVRNTRDGGVEVVIEGEEAKVEKMVAWCYHGPSGAIVRDVEYRAEDYTGEYDSFFIKY